MGAHFTRGDYTGNFLRKVLYINECWIWNASTKNGYGQYGSGYAHRHSYGMFKGEITPGMFVLHKCSNMLCVNPDHLYLGTQKENIQQAVKEGSIASGERQGLSVLTWDKVREIRKLSINGATQTQLANQFGVSQGTIWQVVSGKTWKEES